MTPSLTLPAQVAKLATLKAHLLANANTIVVGGVETAISAVAGMPNRNDIAPDVAAWYNLTRSPTYKAWRSSLPKQDLIELPSTDSAGSPVSFAVGGGTGSYVDRTVGERDGLALLFNTTLACKPFLANVRVAIFDCFSGTNALSVQNRTQFWGSGQRPVTNAEHLFVSATVGGPTHSANNGNNPGGQTGTRGAWTNPDTLGAEGNLTAAEVIAAWTLP